MEEKKKKVKLNSIYNENNMITMKNIPNNFIDGIICSPQYNLGHNPNHRRIDQDDYNLYTESVDNLTEEEYINVRINEFKEFERIVKEDGVILYNMSYSKENPMLPLILMNKIHQETNLTIADVITWKKSKANPFQTSPNKLTRICELIYVIVNKKHLHTFKANKEISKINEKTGQKFYKNYTNIIEAKNNDGVETKNKATYSTDLVEQLINTYFPTKSIIYDPFMGIGTTAKGCLSKGCYFIGSEIVKEFYEESKTNIKNHYKLCQNNVV
jgi:DNA modification methylase